jgi:hypothetical protein
MSRFTESEFEFPRLTIEQESEDLEDDHIELPEISTEPGSVGFSPMRFPISSGFKHLEGLQVFADPDRSPIMMVVATNTRKGGHRHNKQLTHTGRGRNREDKTAPKITVTYNGKLVEVHLKCFQGISTIKVNIDAMVHQKKPSEVRALRV